MDEPIRVLQVIRLMNPGGAESMVMNLYRNIDRSRIQFDFVETSAEPAAYDEEILSLGGKIFRCPHYNGRNHFVYRKWWNDFFASHAGEYKIVHGHLGSTAAIYLSIAKKHGSYTIAHSHNAGTDRSFKGFVFSLYSYRTRYIADSLIACSVSAGKARYGKRAHVILLRNAIDIDSFSYDQNTSSQIKKTLGLDGKTVIGHIGRFAKQKNHPLLLDIFREILYKLPDAVLLLVGDGGLRDTIEKKALDMGIRDKIIFTGVRSDVSDLLQAMDVFVFPSLYEGLPVTLVEAQGTGLPCVISDRVPVESILADDLVTVMPLRASPGDWADHILTWPGHPRFSRTAELRASGYDIHDTAKWLESFYLSKCNE